MGVRFVIVAGQDGPLPEPLVYELDQERVVIGRGAGADVRIPHLTVSETHASVRSESGAYVITDHASTNGTVIGGAQVAPGRKRKLADGDLLKIGAYTLQFHASLPITRPTTAERTAELARRLFRQWQHGTVKQAPRLVLLTGPNTGRSLTLTDPPSRALIGRAETCQLVLDDPDVSREHAELVRDLDGVLLRNLDSKNGLSVGGAPVQERRLRDGDELLIGTTRLLFEEDADERIKALMGEPDARLPEPASAPAAASAEPENVLPATAEPTRAAVPRRFDAELLVYALAAIVIAASALGLFSLLRN